MKRRRTTQTPIEATQADPGDPGEIIGRRTGRGHEKARAPRATAALEDSRTKPSRKSTRRSANRAKLSQGKERTALARAVTPSARAQRR